MNLSNQIPALSKTVEKFWNNEIKGNYEKDKSSYDSNKFPRWKDVKDFKDLLEKLKSSHSKQYYDLKEENPSPDKYASVIFLSLLKKEGLDITQVYKLASHNQEDKFSLYYDISMYLDYLDFKNEKLDDTILQHFFEEQLDDRRYSSMNDVNGNVEILMKIIKVSNPKDYSWFSDNLKLFTTIEHKRELSHAYENLNYGSQKMLFNYISEHYPEHVGENNIYYAHLTTDKTITSRRLYQAEVEINLYALMDQYKVGQKEAHHFLTITQHCLTVVSGREFQDILGLDIKVSNIQSTEINHNLILKFSTPTPEELDKIERILLHALDGVLKVSDKIHISQGGGWSEDDDTIHTNMDAQFVYKHYNYYHLNSVLASEDKPVKKKKI